MEYIEGGKLEIISNIKTEKKSGKEKPILPCGTIVFCRGTQGIGSFYGIVYSGGVLELGNGSEVYIQTRDYIHLGDLISYWRIEKVVKAKLIIEDIIEEEK